VKPSCYRHCKSIQAPPAYRFELQRSPRTNVNVTESLAFSIIIILYVCVTHTHTHTYTHTRIYVCIRLIFSLSLFLSFSLSFCLAHSPHFFRVPRLRRPPGKSPAEFFNLPNLVRQAYPRIHYKSFFSDGLRHYRHFISPIVICVARSWTVSAARISFTRQKPSGGSDVRHSTSSYLLCCSWVDEYRAKRHRDGF